MLLAWIGVAPDDNAVALREPPLECDIVEPARIPVAEFEWIRGTAVLISHRAPGKDRFSLDFDDTTSMRTRPGLRPSVGSEQSAPPWAELLLDRTPSPSSNRSAKKEMPES